MEDSLLNKRNKRIIAVVAGLIGLLVVIAIVNAIFTHLAEENHTVVIADLETCAERLPRDQEIKYRKLYYDYVDAQLRLDNRGAESSQYSATIREDSCRTTEFRDDNNNLGYTVEFVLDLAELGYSFQARFSYVKDGDPSLVDVDLGTARLYCLPAGQLVYGEFNCSANPLISVATGDATEMNDITNLIPYTDPAQHYMLQLVASTETKSGYTIVITYYPGSSLYLNGNLGDFRKTYRTEIENYLTSHGQNLADYDFFEKWK